MIAPAMAKQSSDIGTIYPIDGLPLYNTSPVRYISIPENVLRELPHASGMLMSSEVHLCLRAATIRQI